MKLNEMEVILVGVVVLALAAILVAGMKRVGERRSTGNTPMLNAMSQTEPEKKVTFRNYLKKPVRITVVKPGRNNEEEVLIDRLGPGESAVRDAVSIYTLVSGNNRLNIYCLLGNSEDSPRVLFSEYEFNLPPGTTIKALHIGMITSRWIGADADSAPATGFNAVQGRPWVKLHNLTSRELKINNNINISPLGVIRYSGRDHFGVRIGTLFEDMEGILPTFQFRQPATDIYFGVVSDIQQPEFGGWQIDTQFDDDPDEPHHLLENGWYGGPAQGNIDSGFVFRLHGSDVRGDQLDIWGDPL